MSPNPLRILLVEDHNDTAELMTKLLNMCGHVVLVAKTCAAALEAAKTGFDLLIADIRLPDGSGVELLQQLRSQRTIKSIATTAEAMPEDIKRCLAAGFDAFLLKPLDFAKLEEAIRGVSMKITSDDMQSTSAIVHVSNVGLACVVEIETERRIVALGKMRMMTYGHWEMLFSHSSSKRQQGDKGGGTFNQLPAARDRTYPHALDSVKWNTGQRQLFR
jgi:CheY-like chemotaxis protein